MAASVVPHFANDLGVEKIYVGVKEFQCMGARPPFDHPHVYLDMGADAQVLCPYCSTLYVHDASARRGRHRAQGLPRRRTLTSRRKASERRHVSGPAPWHTKNPS